MYTRSFVRNLPLGHLLTSNGPMNSGSLALLVNRGTRRKLPRAKSKGLPRCDLGAASLQYVDQQFGGAELWRPAGTEP